MALAELALLEQRLHLVGEVEQPDQVRDRGAAAADAAGELLLGDAEVVDQGGAGAGLVDGVEVLADHVLDQRRLQALVLGRAADHGRDALEAGLLGGAPAALAGDQLVAPVAERAARSAAAAPRPSAIEPASASGRRARSCVRGWSGLGSILVDRQLAQLRARRPRSRAGSPRGRGPSPAFAQPRRPPPRRARGRPGSRRSSGRARRPAPRSWAPRRCGCCAGSPS